MTVSHRHWLRADSSMDGPGADGKVRARVREAGNAAADYCWMSR